MNERHESGIEKPSRRQFIARATVAAGLAGGCATTAKTPTHLAAANAAPAVERRSVGEQETIRCGFVGVGGRGSSLLQSTLERNDVHVVAVTDTYDPWRERALAWCKKQYPEVKGYTHFEDMLAQEELHTVVIATPDHLHAPFIMAALNAGLDVYVEKPMTLTWDEAAVVRDRVRELGAVLQVGTQLRSADVYTRARELVQTGGVGQIVEVQVNRHSKGGNLVREGPPPEANASNVDWAGFLRHTQKYPLDLQRYFMWRNYWEYSNGITGDLMVHHLDLCHYITGCGMPERVMSVGGIYRYDDGRTCPDTISAIMEYPERFQFNYTTTLANGHYGLLERYLGTDGTVEIQGMGTLKWIREGDVQTFEGEGVRDAPHLADFFGAVRSRGETIAPVEAGFMGATCAAMAVYCQQTGHAAQWDETLGQVVT